MLIGLVPSEKQTLSLSYGFHKRGWPANKQTLARWLQMTISEAYPQADLSIRDILSAHFTCRGASPEQLCKAATWSSIDTFLRYYAFDTFASQDVAFGHRVLL